MGKRFPEVHHRESQAANLILHPFMNILRQFAHERNNSDYVRRAFDDDTGSLR